MPNINAGLPERFENGGIVKIYNTAGSVGYDVLNLEPGTLRFKQGYNQKIMYKQSGVLVTKPLVGSEMPGSISLTARVTKGGMTGGTDLLTLARPADSAGEGQTFKIELVLKDYRGASGTTTLAFENCYMPEPPEFQASGEGEDFDKLTFTFVSLDASVAITSA